MPEAPLSPMAVYRARPTVRVDGRENAKLSELLLRMTMTETEGGMASLELRLSNVASDPGGGAGPAFDEQELKFGSAIAVYAGDENAPREIFRGLLTGLEADFAGAAPPEITVLAEDACQRRRMARRTTVHADVSLADLAKKVAATVGLTPVVTGFTEPIGTWVQLNESDLSFLRRVLLRYDGDVQVSGTELQVSPRGEVKRGALDLEMYGQLRRARVLADLAHQVTAVTATGWDAKQGRRVSATSTGAAAGPGAGKPGAAVLRDAIGERSEHLSHPPVTTEAEARALADAAFDQRARRFVRVAGTAEGNPALRVGTHLALTGLGPRFDNTYYAYRACHRYDLVSGYETDFEAECAFVGTELMDRATLAHPPPGPLHAGHLAEVVAVDPTGAARVQVRLLAFDGVPDQDGPAWARVVVPFAGSARGAFLIPDVGDEVLVLFVNGDARLPVVMGGLWNGKAKPPETLGGDGKSIDRWSIVGKAGTRVAIVEDGPPEIAFSTPGGVTGTLTDKGGGKVEVVASGSTVTLDPAGVTVRTGGKVVVQASQVEVTAGQVTVNAAMATFSGVVKCDVLMATTVMGTTYTPGVGNIW